MANCPNIPNIYYSKKELKHFGIEILVSLEYCFKYFQVYILIHLYQNQKRKKFIHKTLNYIKGYKDFNTLKLYTLKALLSKNRFYFFFLIFWCHVTGINSSLSSFLSALRFSNLVCEAKSDMSNSTRIIFIKISIVKVNPIKTYIKNTYFIKTKCNTTKIFFKIEYIFICM